MKSIFKILDLFRKNHIFKILIIKLKNQRKQLVVNKRFSNYIQSSENEEQINIKNKI